MLDNELLREYQQLFNEVSPQTRMLAHINVCKYAKLPERGPKGSKVNEVRVNIFMGELVKELHRLIEIERG